MSMQLPSVGWWTFPQVNNWGSFPDPQGYFPKPDVNIVGLPSSYPLAAILPGVVTGINTPGSSAIPPFGAVITIELDKPLNSIATHYAMLHLARVQPGLQVGSSVAVGDIIGYGGANQTQGSASAPVGFALYPGDYYGFGTEWNRYINTPSKIPDARLDPTSVLKAAATGSLNNIVLFTSNKQAQNSLVGNTANGFKVLPVGPLLEPNENVTGVLQALDNAMLIIDPVPNDVDTLNIFGGTVPNPISWIDAFFHNLFIVDLPALIFRGIIISIGVYMCFTAIKASILASGAAKVVSGTRSIIEGE